MYNPAQAQLAAGFAGSVSSGRFGRAELLQRARAQITSPLPLFVPLFGIDHDLFCILHRQAGALKGAKAKRSRDGQGAAKRQRTAPASVE